MLQPNTPAVVYFSCREHLSGFVSAVEALAVLTDGRERKTPSSISNALVLGGDIGNGKTYLLLAAAALFLSRSFKDSKSPRVVYLPDAAALMDSVAQLQMALMLAYADHKETFSGLQGMGSTAFCSRQQHGSMLFLIDQANALTPHSQDAPAAARRRLDAATLVRKITSSQLCALSVSDPELGFTSNPHAMTWCLREMTQVTLLRAQMFQVVQD